jgi:hypothetical protein
MLEKIQCTSYWEQQQKVLEQWNDVCEALFNPFSIRLCDLEKPIPVAAFTGMMMCAFCGVVGFGCQLGARAERRNVEEGGRGVNFAYMPAQPGTAPAAAAYPWLAQLVEAKSIPPVWRRTPRVRGRRAAAAAGGAEAAAPVVSEEADSDPDSAADVDEDLNGMVDDSDGGGAAARASAEVLAPCLSL